MGEIVAVAGMESITIGETLTDPQDPRPLAGITVDPPTVCMSFVANDSPFYGKEGRFVTSRHLRERLFRETLSDVALGVEELGDAQGYKVSGRGELHLSILIEKMRREGYEFQVTRPQAIFREVDGRKLEPYEELIVDVDENYMGKVIENLGRQEGNPPGNAPEKRHGEAQVQDTDARAPRFPLRIPHRHAGHGRHELRLSRIRRLCRRDQEQDEGRARLP